jgi:hypothetical protein
LAFASGVPGRFGHVTRQKSPTEGPGPSAAERGAIGRGGKSERRALGVLRLGPKSTSVLPKILEPVRRHFGVSHSVHYIFVPHVVLERSGIMPVVGQLVAGRVPEPYLSLDSIYGLG